MGLPARDAVGRKPLAPLKAAQSGLGLWAEFTVRLEFSGARPVQGELEQGHRRARAPHPQDAHAIPPFCFQVSICTQTGAHADAALP